MLQDRHCKRYLIMEEEKRERKIKVKPVKGAIQYT